MDMSSCSPLFCRKEQKSEIIRVAPDCLRGQFQKNLGDLEEIDHKDSTNITFFFIVSSIHSLRNLINHGIIDERCSTKNFNEHE